MNARLQLALDFIDLHRALTAAEEAVEGGVHILEIGTPLLKAEGLEVTRIKDCTAIPHNGCRPKKRRRL